MILGIDLTYTLGGGALVQVEQIVRNLGCFEQNAHLIIYTKTPNLHLFDKVSSSKVRIHLSRFCGIGVIARIIWEQIALPLLLKKHKVDVLFCPGNIAPFFSPSKTIQWIGTIGPFWDEFYKLKIPIMMKIKFRANKVLMWRTAQYSDRVIFESEYCRKLFVSEYGIKPKRTEVIRIGKDNFFYPEIVEANEFKVNGMYIQKPFILCVSHLYEYKNFERLIEAFSIAKKNFPKGTTLAIAGSIIKQLYYQIILQTIKRYGCESDVVYMGLVNKEDLRLLYSNCRVFVFPSLVETIGYILVEAMLCGAPIVTSNTTSMPETCGDAALYFDPTEVTEIANSMMEVSNDEGIRNNLSRTSLARVEQFPDFTEVNQRTADIIKELARDAI